MFNIYIYILILALSLATYKSSHLLVVIISYVLLIVGIFFSHPFVTTRVSKSLSCIHSKFYNELSGEFAKYIQAKNPIRGYIPLLTLGCVLLLAYILMPFLRYGALHTSYYDMGLALNNFYKIDIHNNYYLGHFNLFYLPFALLYKVIPAALSSYIFIFIQLLGILTGLYVIYRNWGLLPFCTSFLAFPIWYASLNSFNFEFLSFFFLTIFFSAAKRHKYTLSVIMALLVGLTKTPYILITIGCLLYLYLVNKSNKNFRMMLYKRRNIIYILIIAILTLISFVVFKSDIFNNYTNDLLTNDLDKHHYSRNLIFIIFILIAFGLTPILAPIHFLPVSGIFLLLILSSNPLHTSIASHYTLVFVPSFAVSISYLYNKYRLQNKLFAIRLTLFLIVCAHLVGSPSPLSFPFWSNYNWFYSRDAYIVTKRDIRIRYALKSFHWEKKDSVVYQNNLNFYPLYNRSSVNVFPNSVNGASGGVDADYVVIDTKRPPFLNDQSCSFKFNSCSDFEFYNKYIDEVNLLDKRYTVVYSDDGFYIYKLKLKLKT